MIENLNIKTKMLNFELMTNELLRNDKKRFYSHKHHIAKYLTNRK